MSGQPQFSEEFIETFMDGPCIVLLGDRSRELASKFDGSLVFVHNRGEELALPNRPTFGKVLMIFDATLGRSIQNEADAQRAGSYFSDMISYANADEPPPLGLRIIPVIGEPCITITVQWPLGGGQPANGAHPNGVNGRQIERVAVGLQHCFDRLYREF